MADFLRFLQSYELWIYALLGLISLVYIRRIALAWRAWQRSLFGIEREKAQNRFSAALSILALLLLLSVAEFILVTFVVPAYPRLEALSTPTLALMDTQVVLQPASDGTIPAETPLAATPTPPGTNGCVEGQLEWQSPKSGEAIQGEVELVGTVNILDFGFYKYEFAQIGSENWIPIAAGDQPKVNEKLGSWSTSALPIGDYQLRLVVADNQNNLYPPCVITVQISNP